MHGQSSALALSKLTNGVVSRSYDHEEFVCIKV